MLAFEPGKAEDAVAFIKENFVCVAFDAYIPGNTEEEVKFGMSVTGANNSFWLAAAGGKKLSARPYHVLGLNSCLGGLRQAVDEFRKLDQSERKPKLSPAKTPVEDKERIPSPPPGGLVATVYTRFLERTGDDFARAKNWYAHGCDGKPHVLEPHTRDVFWLTEAEWKSLVPANPAPGTKFPVPDPIKKRIFRYHANVNWPDGGDEGPLREGELTLTVQSASAAAVILRLDGFVRKGDFAASQSFFASKENYANHFKARGQGGIDLRFLGYLAYDLKKKSFSRFDVVAVGDCWGLTSMTYRGNLVFGRCPIGLAFELNTGDRPADRIPPKNAPAYAGGAAEYFSTR